MRWRDQGATATQQGWIYQSKAIDPKTFVPDLKTLMKESDEVILAGGRYHAAVLSPSGKSPANVL